jgi:hypothetical protein
MKNFSVVFISFLFGIHSFSQNGSVEIVKDVRIDGLIRKQGLAIPRRLLLNFQAIGFNYFLIQIERKWMLQEVNS